MTSCIDCKQKEGCLVYNQACLSNEDRAKACESYRPPEDEDKSFVATCDFQVSLKVKLTAYNKQVANSILTHILFLHGIPLETVELDNEVVVSILEEYPQITTISVSDLLMVEDSITWEEEDGR